MDKKDLSIRARFSRLHYVDQDYHSNHSQLLHSHEDCLELLYIMSGEGQYIVGGRQWPVHSGNLVICNAGVLHGETYFSANNMETYCCVLDNISIGGMPGNDFQRLTQNPILNFVEERQCVEHLILALASLNPEAAAFSKTRDLLAETILIIVCEKLLQRHQEDTVLHNNVDDFIDLVIKYLETYYKEPITLSDLGNRFHVSHYYLSHIFKEQTGYSPMKYVVQLKIGEAQKLLMNTEKSIGSISEELGFSDNSHFNVMFKKYTGLSPTEYRQYFKNTTV